MKIEKLKSGSYRIRKMYKGVTYTVITDYKPTQKEAMLLMAEEMQHPEVVSERFTFEVAGNKYIAKKTKEQLSPTTIREYKGIMNRISSSFKQLIVQDITQKDIDEEVQRYSVGRKPKTVRNFHGFISSVLKTYHKSLNISTVLPKKERCIPHIPSSDDVKRLLDYCKGSEFEIPILLACYGMRRSEICALTPADINNDVVTINKALVMDSNKKWVLKTTKTASSTREIIIPIEICDKIREKGYVYKGHPNNISDYIRRALKDLNMEHFSLHKLRHYFASVLSDMNIPEADIMRLGGWETDHVMKAVYRHSMATRERDRETSARICAQIL